jgi:hypothetical protein
LQNALADGGDLAIKRVDIQDLNAVPEQRLLIDQHPRSWAISPEFRPTCGHVNADVMTTTRAWSVRAIPGRAEG